MRLKDWRTIISKKGSSITGAARNGKGATSVPSKKFFPMDAITYLRTFEKNLAGCEFNLNMEVQYDTYKSKAEAA